MTPYNHEPTVAIIGGGISGLTTAYLLQKKGINVSVFEKDREPGGVIKSNHEQQWLLERGPNTIMANLSSSGI